jgi:hypothetical protein
MLVYASVELLNSEEKSMRLKTILPFVDASRAKTQSHTNSTEIN